MESITYSKSEALIGKCLHSGEVSTYQKKETGLRKEVLGSEVTFENVRIKPDEVLVRPFKRKVVKGSAGEIEVVEVGQKLGYDNSGRVYRLGEGKYHFNVGEDIMFYFYAGRELVLGGINFLVMNKENIFAVLEKE